MIFGLFTVHSRNCNHRISVNATAHSHGIDCVPRGVGCPPPPRHNWFITRFAFLVHSALFIHWMTFSTVSMDSSDWFNDFLSEFSWGQLVCLSECLIKINWVMEQSFGLLCNKAIYWYSLAPCGIHVAPFLQGFPLLRIELHTQGKGHMYYYWTLPVQFSSSCGFLGQQGVSFHCWMVVRYYFSGSR